MRALAIDPGSSVSHWTVLEASMPHELDDKPEWLASGKLANGETLGASVERLAREHEVSVVAVETIASRFVQPGQGMHLAQTAQAAGEIVGWCRKAGLDVRCIPSFDWRKWLCNRPSAKDAQISHALSFTVHMPKRSNPHTRDAAGLALYVLSSNGGAERQQERL